MLVGSLGGSRPLAELRGVTLSAVGDAGALRLAADGPTGTVLEDPAASVWQLRGGVEARHEGIALSDPGWLMAPRGSLALRPDGGDGLTGTGLEMAGGLSLLSPGSHFVLDADGHWLALHSAETKRAWGASVEARLDPGAGGRGLSLSFGPRLGTARDETALERDGAFGEQGPQASGAASLDAQVGYGRPAFGGRGLRTPWLGLSDRGHGGREWRAGMRLRLGALDLAIEGALGEGELGERDQRVGLDLRLPFGAAAAGSARARIPAEGTSLQADPPAAPATRQGTAPTEAAPAPPQSEH